MKLMEDIIRIINAASKFKIKDNFEFVSFDDLTHEMGGLKSDPESIEIWAAVKIYYEGELPESYKALNLLIGNWVETNKNRLTEVLHAELRDHFEEKYKGSNVEALDELDDTAIWLDQLDYMPGQVEDERALIIEIDLVLHAEPVEE